MRTADWRTNQWLYGPSRRFNEFNDECIVIVQPVMARTSWRLLVEKTDTYFATLTSTEDGLVLPFVVL